MNLFEYYITYFSELCEGTRTAAEGLRVTQSDPEARAMELQEQISEMGIAEFVRICAKQDGTEIPQEEFDNFSESAMLDALRQMQSAPQEQAPAEKEEEPPASEIRDIYEVFLDSVCLDDRLVSYLIEVLKTRDMDAFATLSHAAARTILDMDDFLSWLQNKQLLGTVEEQACVRIMDGVFDRLLKEGQKELLAALISGDEAVFCRFRADCEELRHLPDATYDWYNRYYLNGYYPVRFLLKANGVVFPED